MKSSQLLLLSFLLVVLSIASYGQEVSIELVKAANKDYHGKCFNIEVTLEEGRGRLSSQNYRLYYDAATLRFDRRSALSALTTSVYNPLKVVQAMHDSNASGYGNLDFSSNIGYINMTITDDVSYPSLSNTPLGVPIKTASFCFEVLSEDADGDIVWARDPLTKGYASAFTELSIMTSEGTREVFISKYTDIQEHVLNPSDKMAEANID